MTFGSYLQRLRGTLSLHEAAIRCGITPKRIEVLENSLVPFPPTGEEVLKILKGFPNASFSELIRLKSIYSWKNAS